MTPRRPIFDSAPRSDASPSRHLESTFEFLNRIHGLFWEETRALVQRWADDLADGTYNEVRQNLRARNDEQFRSTFLELYLHAAFLAAGYDIVVHPEIPRTTRRPDFLVERDGQRIYIEAIAPGTPPSAQAVAQRKAVVIDAINALSSPNFYLSLDRFDAGQYPLGSKSLRRALSDWLNTLNPDEKYDRATAPRFHWSDSGWTVSLSAIPKSLERRGTTQRSRSIGIYAHGEAEFVDDAATIRKALNSKSKAYGPLDEPFIIVIGTYMFDTDDWGSTNAFYGNEAFLIENAGGTSRAFRQNDGYFGRPGEWRNRSTSGVLIVNQLMPYSVLQAATVLWRHPDPVHALPDQLGLPWFSVALTDSLVRSEPHISPAELFRLPEDWPPGEAWPSDQRSAR